MPELTSETGSAQCNFIYGFDTVVGVLNGLCEHLEHASIEFIFVSTSSDQLCLASNEHFKKYR